MTTSEEAQGLSLFIKIPLTIIPFIACVLLYRYYITYIRPKHQMEFYRKQGVSCEFVPVTGQEQMFIDNVEKHGDSQYYFKALNGREKYRLKCYNAGNEISISIRDTDLIKEFCLNPDNYVKDPDYLGLLGVLLGNGLLSTDGPVWKQQRKLISQAFHFEHLKSVMPLTRDTTREILANVQKGSMKGVDIMDVFQDITGVMVGKIFFGEMLAKYNFEGQKLTTALADLIAEVGQLNLSEERFYLGTTLIKLGLFPKHRKLFNKVRRFRDLCLELTREKKKLFEQAKSEGKYDGKPKDIMEIFFEYTNESGNKLDDEQLIDQFITFFSAGMDTTGHITALATYYLIKYPEYYSVMMQEIKENYKNGEDVGFDVLNRLEFMMCFIKELLRTMCPVPAILPRRAIVDHKLGEFTIKKGTILELDFFYNSFHPDFFSDPQKFDPSRWENGWKPQDVYAFIPFNAGQRNCIGQHFALFEARIILAEFLNMYDFKLVEPYELKMHSTFLYEPVDIIRLDLTPKVK